MKRSFGTSSFPRNRQKVVSRKSFVSYLVFRWDGDVADLLLLERLGFHGGDAIRIAFGQLRPGINRIFLALFGPGLFPDLAFAQAAGFVAQDR